MTEALVAVTLVLALVALVLLAVLLKRAPGASEAALERQLGSLRGENTGLESRLREELARNREASDRSAKEQREELGKQMKLAIDSLDAGLAAMRNASDERFENLRATIDRKLKEIQEGNAAKLDEMRKTVDEKLQGTLEKRLGESFKQVSERLELVHKGLGEMQTLASGVGDLKRVLTNVKTRGTWGEVQLSNLLEQILIPEQYAANVATKPGSPERVEFAIKLPGRERGEGQVWLPIDAKFPKEDYERLVEAAERANPEAVELAAKALEEQVRHEASEIQKKYVDPPHTTDFGILFLPTEGLYAEVLRRPGLAERLQRENRVMVAGPTTLAALLNSLQMGFRTLAIEQRSSEVWQVLGAVKTEFAKFGEVMDKVQKKLQEATNVIDTAKSRSNVIRRKLKDVEGLPSAQATALLGTPEEVDGESDTTEAGGEG
jgi:DNA recombination protein RmuC